MGAETPGTRALIDENLCIGCTLCIQACPVDAIVGCAKHMHTVLCAYCTGCELCVEPCPVDCISMVPVAQALCNNAEQLAPRRRELREARIAREQRERAALFASASSVSSGSSQPSAKQAAIAAAIARAKARLAGAR
jgi:Na+-translocating ferredoxin:NAD+ oxidoreductase subunit B